MESAAIRWPGSHLFEDGVLWQVGIDGELTEVARVDVSTLDSLLLSVAKIRAVLVAAGAVAGTAGLLLFAAHAGGIARHPVPAAHPHHRVRQDA